MIEMTRPDFLKKLARSLLIAFLAFLALSLGSKAVRGNDCSACRGKGICDGDIDCVKYSK